MTDFSFRPSLRYEQEIMLVFDIVYDPLFFRLSDSHPHTKVNRISPKPYVSRTIRERALYLIMTQSTWLEIVWQSRTEITKPAAAKPTSDTVDSLTCTK
jgi:hypothetical protein